MANYKRKTYRKKKTTTARRKYYKKPAAKKMVVQRTTVPIGLGFPKKMVVTHKYVENITLTSTTAGFASYVFSCNGMFDPNITATGHQPSWFDTCSTIYNHYLVIGSKCQFIITPETTTTNTIRVNGYIDDQATVSPGSMDLLSEQTQAKKPIYFSAGNNGVKNVNLKWSAKKFFGPGLYANNDLKALSTANPVEQSYFVLCAQADDVATIALNVTAYISYIAIWEELKEVASS